MAAKVKKSDPKVIMKKNGFRCQTCKKSFQSKLPYQCPIEVWVEAAQAMKCPNCESKKIHMGENRTLAEDRAIRQGETYQERYEDLQINGEKGLSSQAMFSHLTGEILKIYSYPRDISDLRRCILMMDRFPEWNERVSEMKFYPEWGKLTEHWQKITEEFNADESCSSSTALAIFRNI